MTDGGFTKSYRAKWNHPVFRNLRDASVWAWLTDSAVWRATRTRFCDRVVGLERGQIVTSERFLASGFCVDRQVIRRLLDTLEREQMITREKTHGGTIITICNYDKYQISLEHGNPPENPSRTHDKPTTNPNKKESKEVKEVKEENNNVDFEVWYAAYPLHKGRGQAVKAYGLARKKASAETLLAAIASYKKMKPGYVAWAHPASWLNGERWLDEPESPAENSGETDEEIMKSYMDRMRQRDLLVGP